jgi:hypothetical protein
LPASLRFWKTRIEVRDPEQTFNVGLLYGPSGCGKSSLVKAGLVPRLSGDVIPLYIEATPDETETRIKRAMQKHIAHLPAGATLADTFAWLRRQTGPEVVITVDQFEQWLHCHRAENSLTMLFALGLCASVCCYHSLLYYLPFCFAGLGYYTAQLIRDCY